MSVTERIDCRRTGNWQSLTVDRLGRDGYVVVEGVLDEGRRAASMDALLRASKEIRADFEETLQARREERCLSRLILNYDRHFLDFLTLPEPLAIIDSYLTPAAVLRYQTGVIYAPDDGERVDNQKFHRNFPYIHGTAPVALDMAFLLTDMTEDNGKLLVVPGSHGTLGRLTDEELLAEAIPVGAPAGAVVILDGSVWHREEPNRTAVPLVMVTEQFTHPLIKPHFDFPRVLGKEAMLALPERTRRLLGWETRLPVSLREFYSSDEDRLFRDLKHSPDPRDDESS